MPHLLSYADNDQGRILSRHLCHVANNPKHLGAGYITYMMSKDYYKNFIWGSFYHEGIVDKACGYWGQSSSDGEHSVADQLRNAIKSGNSNWPYQGNEWNTQDFGQPCYWYFTGGMCLSGVRGPDLACESALAVTAYHFTLPEVYRNQNLRVVEAQIKFKGLGAYVQNIVRPSGKKLFYSMQEWDDNNSIWGTDCPLHADSYPDSQSIAVHLIHGANLNRSLFDPSKCFYVYTRDGNTSYELRNLQQSFMDKNGRLPTNSELLTYFNVDLNDEQNKHWKMWGWEGSRSIVPSSDTRFYPHALAMLSGGAEAIQPLFTAGSNWGFPYISGASPYPVDDTYIFKKITLTEEDKTALTSENGLWVIVHGLPMLNSKCYTGGQYLPNESFDWEFGPWSGAQSQSAVGRYIGAAIHSLDTFQLLVTLGE